MTVGTGTRHFRQVFALVLLCGFARAQPQDIPAGFGQIDSSFRKFLQTYSIPGASLAIAKDGRLVLAKGYGLADVDALQPVQPNLLFRFGSLGKTITAIAVMKLVGIGEALPRRQGVRDSQRHPASRGAPGRSKDRSHNDSEPAFALGWLGRG